MLKDVEVRKELPYKNTPYDKESLDHKWHAVVKARHGNIGFISSDTKEGLQEGLSDYGATPEILAIYEGRLVPYNERRSVEL